MDVERRIRMKPLFRKLLMVFLPMAAVAAYVLLNRFLLGAFVICPFRALTSFPCPGCGLTHAGTALLRLDIKASLKFHALFIPVAGTIVLTFLPKGISRLTDWAKRQYWWYAVLVAALLAYYGYRMAFCYPGRYPLYRHTKCYLSIIGLNHPPTHAERARMKLKKP